ncbi:rhodanese-like domain-containing protein [uncultured Tenacibaculum sp.]|uniref:rhodanese-like domain-containing protein n=1 Tax=uncultured Tenacibaculum sp. TaxID=174713 RepID=UPI002635E546|nr:rhodanese-like domain-containing protein [uncultured Tenacibaculum sp.]
MKKSFIILVTLISFLSCNTSQETSNVTQLNVVDYKKAISKENIQLIDVRTLKEFDKGHIPKAKSIDYFSSTFKADLNTLDKTKPIYLYCKSGKRSTKASKICDELGFKKIYNLTGGYLAWSKENN